MGIDAEKSEGMFIEQQRRNTHARKEHLKRNKTEVGQQNPPYKKV